MLSTWLKQSKHTVIFSGAGMSTESGVPDFRSKNGLWQGKDPTKLASTEALRYNREEFVAFYKKRIEVLQGITPHKGYDILNKWANNGLVKAVITQNTDGLHEKTCSIPVYPIHGTIGQLHCERCGEKYAAELYVQDETVCTRCGGFMRPSVVLFGESLPVDVLEAAIAEAEQADLFIVLGSSLVVSPANSFPLIAKQNGAKLVIINFDPTPLDHYADVVINERKIGDVLVEVNSELMQQI